MGGISPLPPTRDHLALWPGPVFSPEVLDRVEGGKVGCWGSLRLCALQMQALGIWGHDIYQLVTSETEESGGKRNQGKRQ